MDFDGFEDAETLRLRQSKINLKTKPPTIDIIDDEETFGEIVDKKTLKEQVKYLHQLEEKQAKVAVELKKLNKGKGQLRRKIAAYMSTNDLEVLELPDGVKYSLSKTTSKINPLTVKRLPMNISKWLIEKENMTSEGALQRSEEILNFIRGTAEKIEKMSLRKHKTTTTS